MTAWIKILLDEQRILRGGGEFADRLHTVIGLNDHPGSRSWHKCRVLAAGRICPLCYRAIVQAAVTWR